MGFALSETVGVGADTEMVTDWAALPPGPVQVNVNWVALVRFDGALRAARRLTAAPAAGGGA